NSPVVAAEGCDLLILFFKINIKRSQPSAAPTGIVSSPEMAYRQLKPLYQSIRKITGYPA
ncbi:hypothetical protein, partial [Pseudomonas sp. PS01303]|uniref:hypothetical protein n=1 Tax=Pseudomonas sp. PS01303 TaxID=2991439 RepID=UPI002499D9A3